MDELIVIVLDIMLCLFHEFIKKKNYSFVQRNDWDRMLAVRTFASVVCPPGSEREHDITLHCPLLWMVSVLAKF